MLLKNAFPAIIAMLMTLIYNLADTYFIGILMYIVVSGKAMRQATACA